MGEVRALVVLENGDDRGLARRGVIEPDKIRRVETDLLVDTGAVLVRLPQDMVEALGLGAMDKAVVTLANDEKVEMSIAGPLVLTALGRTMNTDCLVGPPRCEPLLGQVVLERLDLIVDPTRRRLTVRPESPFLPSLKAKSAARGARRRPASRRRDDRETTPPGQTVNGKVSVQREDA